MGNGQRLILAGRSSAASVADLSARLARRGRLGWLILGIALGLLASGIVWLSRLEATHLPPLVQDPNGDSAVRGEALSRRLRERFPVGSPEADLIRELWLEGFAPTAEWRGPRRQVDFDTFREPGFNICRTTAIVSWEADATGRLTDVAGVNFLTCP